MLLNAGGFNPGANSNTRWKRDVLCQELISLRERGVNVPFIGITESWLKSYHLDAQVAISGYTVVRADRSNRQGGGALLYVDDGIPIEWSSTFDDGRCEALFCRLSSCSLNIAVIYRPPDTPSSSFYNSLEFLNKQIERTDPGDDLIIMGDFNLPVINWDSIVIGGRSAENTRSAQALLDFMGSNFLEQFVNLPTRGSNILDLFLSNRDSLVEKVNVVPTEMSDHNLVSVGLTFHPVCPKQRKRAKLESFRSLDFHNGDFDLLRERLSEIDWDGLRQASDFESFPSVFTDTLYQMSNAKCAERYYLALCLSNLCPILCLYLYPSLCPILCLSLYPSVCPLLCLLLSLSQSFILALSSILGGTGTAGESGFEEQRECQDDPGQCSTGE